MYNLLTDSFFPVLLRSGYRSWICASELLSLSGEDDDFPVEFAWPRADFNIAAHELALGIAQLALDLRDEDVWEDLWAAPLSRPAWEERLRPFVPAFELGGDSPRFLQAFEPLDGAPAPVEALLIDTPGQNGQKKNADLLTHRARFPAFGLRAAAMALYTLQAFAPSGGAGNRTSMRGGGPLSALVVPLAADGAPQPLARRLLANLVPMRAPKPERLAAALPWLAPTLVSDKTAGRQVHPHDGDVEALQVYFGMPRRIRLVVSEERGRCPLSGEEEPLVTDFVQKPWGVDYGPTWQHPLTPYRQQNETSEPFSLKAKSGRLSYRDWVGVAIGAEDQRLARPAEAVRLARGLRRSDLMPEGAAEPRLRVGGWAMNNMEAIAYLFAEEPLHLAPTEAEQKALDDLARRFAEAGSMAASCLRRALKSALFGDGASVALDKGVLDAAGATFIATAEAAFHAGLAGFLADPAQNEEAATRRFLGALRKAALAEFEERAPVPLDKPEDAGRIVAALSRLQSDLSGRTGAGKKLFGMLRLPEPQRNKATTEEPA
ncbi:type I-E CRISPR-associated protein Cse1/CasA [Afifella sp. JA880]|uniref:type I-E CRISPR-associated protein Cse1/CasA n=1 Tax=Afifella sp. JA880 TaxID=2975280 RepID=UPI0021BA42A4|nr:type I-E CRISPR-associated protein Cse1/CasA [Afifella sp. JA880]MCT8266466.1 type I-E CRISPR-associated protein Cse1/CasA [Afifella sp. JA880]